MSMHGHLPPQARKDLKNIGWTKGRELAKLARAEGQQFDCAPWVHKARSMPREKFTREVGRELTGRESEPSELIYFKVYKSQAPVIEQAIDRAALMLGSDTSRGYCLEMIRADFLAGRIWRAETCRNEHFIRTIHLPAKRHPGCFSATCARNSHLCAAVRKRKGCSLMKSRRVI